MNTEKEEFLKYIIEKSLIGNSPVVRVYNTNRKGINAIIPIVSYKFTTFTQREEWINEFKEEKLKHEETKGQRRFPRDNRSTEIKRIIKTTYPNVKVRVRIDKYSMGESINVYTDFQDSDKIKELIHQYEQVSRDEYSGEILSGGNTYLFVGELRSNQE